MIAGVIPEFRWGVGFAQAWRPAYPVDGVRYWDRPRTVDRVVTLTGVEDAWITGTDYYASGRVRWLGRGQYAADAGFAGLVRAAREGAVRLYPDPATAPDWFVSVYVEGVDEVTPEAEADFTMASDLTVRGVSGATVAPAWLAMGPGLATGVTLTRSTTGTQWNHSSGLLELAASNTIRTSWRRTSAGRWESGWLIEGSGTNRLLRSEDFTTTWTLDGVTVSANQRTAPDGASTGDQLVETATLSGHRAIQSYTGTINTAQLLSCYVQRGTRDWCLLALDGGSDTNRVIAWFNLRTGVVGTVSNQGTGSGATAWMEPASPGWWRVYLTGVPATGVTTFRASVGGASADNVISYTGTTGNSLFAWGAQVEDNVGYPSSYYGTVGSTATRGADTFARTLTGTPIANGPRPLTVYHRGVLLAPWGQFPSAGYPVVVGDAGTTLNLGVGKVGASTAGGYLQCTGVTAFAAPVVGTPVPGDVLEFALALRADWSVSAAVAINHGVPATATSATLDREIGGLAWGAQSIQPVGGPLPWLYGPTVIAAGVRSLPEMRALAGVAV